MKVPFYLDQDGQLFVDIGPVIASQGNWVLLYPEGRIDVIFDDQKIGTAGPDPRRRLNSFLLDVSSEVIAVLTDKNRLPTATAVLEPKQTGDGKDGRELVRIEIA